MSVTLPTGGATLAKLLNVLFSYEDNSRKDGDLLPSARPGESKFQRHVGVPRPRAYTPDEFKTYNSKYSGQRVIMINLSNEDMTPHCLDLDMLTSPDVNEVGERLCGGSAGYLTNTYLGAVFGCTSCSSGSGVEKDHSCRIALGTTWNEEIVLPDRDGGSEKVLSSLILPSITFVQSTMLLIAKFQQILGETETSEGLESRAVMMYRRAPRRGLIIPWWLSFYDDERFTVNITSVPGRDSSLEDDLESRPVGLHAALPYTWSTDSDKVYMVLFGKGSNDRYIRRRSGKDSAMPLSQKGFTFNLWSYEVFLGTSDRKDDVLQIDMGRGDVPVMMNNPASARRDTFLKFAYLSESGTKTIEAYNRRNAIITYKVTYVGKLKVGQVTRQFPPDGSSGVGKVSLADRFRLICGLTTESDLVMKHIISEYDSLPEAQRALMKGRGPFSDYVTKFIFGRPTTKVESRISFEESSDDAVISEIVEELGLNRFDAIEVQSTSEKGMIVARALNGPRLYYRPTADVVLDITAESFYRLSEPNQRLYLSIRGKEDAEISKFLADKEVEFPSTAEGIFKVFRSHGSLRTKDLSGNLDPLTNLRYKWSKTPMTELEFMKVVTLGYPVVLGSLKEKQDEMRNKKSRDYGVIKGRLGMVYSKEVLKIKNTLVAKYPTDDEDWYAYVSSPETFGIVLKDFGISEAGGVRMFNSEARGFMMSLRADTREVGHRKHAMILTMEDSSYSGTVRFPSGVSASKQFHFGSVVNGVQCTRSQFTRVFVRLASMQLVEAECLGYKVGNKIDSLDSFMTSEPGAKTYSDFIAGNLGVLAYVNMECEGLRSGLIGTAPTGVAAGCDMAFFLPPGTYKTDDVIKSVNVDTSSGQKIDFAFGTNCIHYVMTSGSPVIVMYFTQLGANHTSNFRYIFSYYIVLTQIAISQFSAQKSATASRTTASNVNSDVNVSLNMDTFKKIIKTSVDFLRTAEGSASGYVECRAITLLVKKISVLLLSIELSRKPFNFGISSIMSKLVGLPISRDLRASNDSIAQFRTLV